MPDFFKGLLLLKTVIQQPMLSVKFGTLVSSPLFSHHQQIIINATTSNGNTKNAPN